MSHTPLSHTKSRRGLTGLLRRSRPRKHARLQHRQLRCEPLEDRRLLSVYANTTALAIPDAGKVTSQINVPDDFSVGDLNVKVTIEHTRDPDLDVFLIAPDNTRVELFTDVGTTRSKNFTSTVLDDAATTSITLGTAPFTGTFRPEGNLSAVEGKPVQGSWKLEITDDTKKSTGTLKSWSIDVESAGVPAGNFIDTNIAMLGNAGMNDTGGLLFQKNRCLGQRRRDGGVAGVERARRYRTLERHGSEIRCRLVADPRRHHGERSVKHQSQPRTRGRRAGELPRRDRADGYWFWRVYPPRRETLCRRVWLAAGRIPCRPRSSRTTGQHGVRCTRGVTRAVVAWCDEVARDAKINRLDNFASGSWSGEELAENLPPDPGINPTEVGVAMAGNGDFILVFRENAPP